MLRMLFYLQPDNVGEDPTEETLFFCLILFLSVNIFLDGWLVRFWSARLVVISDEFGLASVRLCRALGLFLGFHIFILGLLFMILCIIDFRWIRVCLPRIVLIFMTILLCTLSATHNLILSIVVLVCSLLWIEDLFIILFVLDSLWLFALVFVDFGVRNVAHASMPSFVALRTDRLALVAAAINTSANDLKHLIFRDH